MATKQLSRLDALIAILDVLATTKQGDRLPVLETLGRIEFNSGNTGGLDELLGDDGPSTPLSVASSS